MYFLDGQRYDFEFQFQSLHNELIIQDYGCIFDENVQFDANFIRYIYKYLFDQFEGSFIF